MVNTIIHSNTNIYAYMYVPMIKSYLRLTVFPSLSYFFLIPTYSFFLQQKVRKMSSDCCVQMELVLPSAVLEHVTLDEALEKVWSHE